MKSPELIRRCVSGLGALAMSLACGYVFVAAPLQAESERAVAEIRGAWTSTRLRDAQSPRVKTPSRAETSTGHST